MLKNVHAVYLLYTAPHEKQLIETSVHVRRWLVAVASADKFHTFDVSMTGNLAIFRQRAARTALNQLRLLLEPERQAPRA